MKMLAIPIALILALANHAAVAQMKTTLLIESERPWLRAASGAENPVPVPTGIEWTDGVVRLVTAFAPDGSGTVDIEAVKDTDLVWGGEGVLAEIKPIRAGEKIRLGIPKVENASGGVLLPPTNVNTASAAIQPVAATPGAGGEPALGSSSVELQTDGGAFKIRAQEFGEKNGRSVVYHVERPAGVDLELWPRLVFADSGGAKLRFSEKTGLDLSDGEPVAVQVGAAVLKVKYAVNLRAGCAGVSVTALGADARLRYEDAEGRVGVAPLQDGRETLFINQQYKTTTANR